MNEVEQKILQILASRPESEISTSDLVKQIFSQKYEEIKKYLYNSQKDQELIKHGKRNNARLHRQLLYHLNNLAKEDFIRVTRSEGKGEKYFVLNGDKQIKTDKEEKTKRLLESFSTIKTEASFLSGLEQYETEKIVKKFDSQNWLTKLNSYIIESPAQQDTKKIYELLTNLYPTYNDVIALNDFQTIIDKEDLELLTNFLKKIDIDTKDYDKYLNLIIDLTQVKNPIKLTDFLSSYANLEPLNILIIFQTNSKTLANQTRLATQIIKNFSEHKLRINIQNKDIHKAPYLLGRAGAYTFNDDDWTQYQENIKNKTIGICCSNTSIYIDVYKFFKEKHTYSEFRELLLKSARASLLATSMQRRKSDILFKTINNLNGHHTSKFFLISYNYIRLWNYGSNFIDLTNLQDENQKFERFRNLLESTMTELNEFCKAEETIFKSCGIPIRYKVVLSSAFERFDKEFMSPRTYKKISIKSLDDFYTETIINQIRQREDLARIFNGGDRVRFFRDKTFTSEEIISEFNFLLNTFNLQLFSYDFESLKGELTLNSFL
ncbi:MAG: hypothetical protein WC758_06605 [Candidatus Woesearchaeota archaeon]|jgi:hypothetical protein